MSMATRTETQSPALHVADSHDLLIREQGAREQPDNITQCPSLFTERRGRSFLRSSPVRVLQLRFVTNPSRTSSSESEPPRFQDPWRSPELEDIDDVGRVHGDVRVNDMVGPQVHPGVTRSQGQDRLDHAWAEVLEH